MFVFKGFKVACLVEFQMIWECEIYIAITINQTKLMVINIIIMGNMSSLTCIAFKSSFK